MQICKIRGTDRATAAPLENQPIAFCFQKKKIPYIGANDLLFFFFFEHWDFSKSLERVVSSKN